MAETAPPRLAMKLLRMLASIAALCALAACSSPTVPPAGQESAGSWKPTPPDAKKMTVFVDQMAAVYRRVGQDVKRDGYRLVFTDVGPESLERAEPDLFAPLLAKGSGGGVRFRGASTAIVDATSVRDRKSGEQGVGFTMTDMKDVGGGAFDVSGAWYEREGAWHEVKYHLAQESGEWRAQ